MRTIVTRPSATRPRPPAATSCAPRSEDAANTADGADASAFATVIAEVATEIASLTVGEAVMRMDLADQAVLMFRNSATGEHNVVYRRADGNIGWIDPSTQAG